jgi:hypothetical protein
MARPSFTEWNFADRAIDPVMLEGKYINARTTLIAAGPPQFEQISDASTNGEMVFPIGFIENFTLNQQKNLQRMYEIGSDRAFFVPGRTINSASLGRVLFHGPSLMRVLYAYYPKEKINLVVPNDTAADNVQIAFAAAHANDPCLPNVLDAPGTSIPTDECTPPEQSPSFFMNLASTLFDRPMGILIYLKDIKDRYYSAFYLEFCYISTHNMNINASSTVIAEGIGLEFDRIVPVDLSQ